MFYNPKNQSVLLDGEVSTIYTYGDLLASEVQSFLNLSTLHKGKYLRYKNHEINVVKEAFSRAPMMCNAIKSRGYTNVLFVGHYNDYQTHWMLDKFSGRMVDLMPEERSDMQTFPDLNIVSQFVPLLWSAMKYEGDFAVVRPTEDKYQGVMHGMYDTFDVSSNALSCSGQYKHGMSGWTLDAEKEEKFDAVVFLGVPMSDPEVGFEEDQVRETFAPYCTPDFEMVDIYYGASYPSKWQNGEAKDFTPHIETAFTVRVSWDEDFGGKYDCPEEFDIMDRMFTVY